MKITKRQAVKANDALIVTEPVGCPGPGCPDVVAVATEPVECAPCEKYANAIDLINGAIESLAQIANGDQVAKDSIANLGVVLFDLKGACC